MSEGQQQANAKDVGELVDKIKASKIDKSGKTAREQTQIRAPSVPKPKPKQKTSKTKVNYRTNTKPQKNINDVAQNLYNKANLPSKEHQDLMVKQYGVSGAKARMKPTVKQVKARLGLAIIEPIVGGAQEATLGLVKVNNRPHTQQLRIIGALATPTAADMIAAYTLSKLALGKKAKRILQKIDEEILYPEKGALNPNSWRYSEYSKTKRAAEAVKWETIFSGSEGFTTTDRRNLNKVLDLTSESSPDIAQTLSNLNKIDEAKIKKYLGNDAYTEFKGLVELGKGADFEKGLTSARRNAPSAIEVNKRIRVITNELDKIIPVKSLSDTDIKYMEGLARDAGLTMDDVIGSLNNAKNLDEKLAVVREFQLRNPNAARMVQVLDDPMADMVDWSNVDDYHLKDFIMKNPEFVTQGNFINIVLANLQKDKAEKLLRDATNLPNSSIRDIIKEYNKPIKSTIEDTTESTGTGEDEQDNQKPIQPDPDPDPTPPKPPTPEPPTPEDTKPLPPEDDPGSTPPLKLSKKQRERRKEMNLQLYSGKTEQYRVKYKSGSRRDEYTVEARGFVEAMMRAQRGRTPTKKLPSSGELVRIK